jgi:hypothetical protein
MRARMHTQKQKPNSGFSLKRAVTELKISILASRLRQRNLSVIIYGTDLSIFYV